MREREVEAADGNGSGEVGEAGGHAGRKAEGGRAGRLEEGLETAAARPGGAFSVPARAGAPDGQAGGAPLEGYPRPEGGVTPEEARGGVLPPSEGQRYSVAAGPGGAATRSPRTAAEAAAEQERMMVEHLPIVRFLARRIHERLPQHVDMEDLVSAGVLGLMDAFTKFDPEKKVQFRSYAQFRIRGAILDSLRTLDWSPRDLRRKGRAVEEAIRSLTARFGRAATESEVAAEMHLSLAAYQQLLGELKGLDIGTLHIERSEDSSEEELAYIPNRPDEDPLFRCLRGEMRQRLADAITELPERERLVMTLYYYEEMTMKEIGLTLGVVESRVSQIHASAVLHLRVLLADLTGRREERPGGRGGEARRGAAPARGPRPL
jgi:RNA polymerase sigma factor for flagellar operon FliA